MRIIGLNLRHPDASACLIENGEVVFAVEEERLRRVKHWAGTPLLSVTACLDFSGIKLSEVDFLAVNRNPWANLGQKLLFAATNFKGIRDTAERAKLNFEVVNLRDTLLKQFSDTKSVPKILKIEHHTAHIASAYFASKFEESAFLSVDGFGDFTSMTSGRAVGKKFNVISKVNFPHSLGFFYQTITQFLGFSEYGDEYKVMGLAPYGQPKFVEKMRELIYKAENGTFELNLDYFNIGRNKSYSYEVVNGRPSFSAGWHPRMVNLLGKNRDPHEDVSEFHADIAASAQLVYEEILWHLLRHLKATTKCNSLAFAGGCSQNSVANGKIVEKTDFEEVYVPPAGSDAGGSIGAALYANAKHSSSFKRRELILSPYLGPSFSNSQIQQQIFEFEAEFKVRGIDYKQLDFKADDFSELAIQIAAGKVVGWFQDRMEFGPRALGNRSILADPRNPNARELLNVKIKRREPFRPFAPVILEEHVSEWFEKPTNVPYMEKVLKIRESKHHQIPAVTHVDGSGRLQTLSERQNPKLFALISSFNVITGVPILLNTSFNENEPIVCSPKEAIATFLRTEMDVLVLQNYLLIRN